jgi:hypothetical protein
MARKISRFIRAAKYGLKYIKVHRRSERWPEKYQGPSAQRKMARKISRSIGAAKDGSKYTKVHPLGERWPEIVKVLG